MRQGNLKDTAIMKRSLMLFVAVAGLVLTGTIFGAAQQEQLEPKDATDLPEKIWKRGLAIAPVPLNLEGKSKRLVGEGSYMVNAMSLCADCHTNPFFLPGGNPFLGQPERINTERYLAGGRTFAGGQIRSANITPDAQGRPAGLTLDQFIEAMRTGKDFKNRHPQISPLLQTHPWPFLGKLTDDDLEAIYEYLRAVPHADPAP
ncbi:MAG TPA: cytochrome C [Blastocatellia bacterium]|nr:cytochrome C [Blastocatellia bacterium]